MFDFLKDLLTRDNQSSFDDHGTLDWTNRWGTEPFNSHGPDPYTDWNTFSSPIFTSRE